MAKGFPVEVLNPGSRTPQAAFYGGVGTNAYGIHLSITQTQISASPVAGTIGNLFSLNGGLGPQPGKAAVIRKIVICSTKKSTFQIRVGVATGPLAGVNIPELDLACIAGPDEAGNPVPVELECDWVIRNGQSVIPYITKILDGTETAVTFWPDVYFINDNFNILAIHTAKIIGTSISNGSGPTSTAYMYWNLMEGEMRMRGAKIRFDLLAGISGSTTSSHYTKVTKGEYDLTDMKTVPPLVFIELAVNDASSGVSGTNYTNRLRVFAEHFLNHPEKDDIMVVILGATPLENSTARANAVVLDAAALALVETLAAEEDYTDRIFFLPGANAFNPLDTTKYASTDTAGSRIHLNDSGCADYHANCTIPFLDGEGAKIITALT